MVLLACFFLCRSEKYGGALFNSKKNMLNISTGAGWRMTTWQVGLQEIMFVLVGAGWFLIAKLRYACCDDPILIHRQCQAPSLCCTDSSQCSSNEGVKLRTTRAWIENSQAEIPCSYV